MIKYKEVTDNGLKKLSGHWEVQIPFAYDFYNAVVKVLQKEDERLFGLLNLTTTRNIAAVQRILYGFEPNLSDLNYGVIMGAKSSEELFRIITDSPRESDEHIHHIINEVIQHTPEPEKVSFLFEYNKFGNLAIYDTLAKETCFIQYDSTSQVLKVGNPFISYGTRNAEYLLPQFFAKIAAGLEIDLTQYKCLNHLNSRTPLGAPSPCAQSFTFYKNNPPISKKFGKIVTIIEQ